MSRVETAPLALGDDWPGVFIRGDNAWGYADSLTQLLQSQGLKAVLDAMPGFAGEYTEKHLWGLIALLRSCNVSVEPSLRVPVQHAPELTRPRHDMIDWTERGEKLRELIQLGHQDD